jgi:hypothetical protein
MKQKAQQMTHCLMQMSKKTQNTSKGTPTNESLQ